MKFPDLPDKTYLTPGEVARFFTVSKRTIYLWCELGELESIKINGVLRIHRISIIKKVQKSDPFLPVKSQRKVISKGISQK